MNFHKNVQEKHDKVPSRKSITHSTMQDQIDTDGYAREYGLKYAIPQIQSGNMNIVCDNGKWVTATEKGIPTLQAVNRMKKENESLLQENNLLKLKLDALLKMAEKI